MVKGLSLIRLFPVSLALAVSLVALAASCTAETESTGRLGVAVTILPQAEFVESVGGEKVGVTVMVPPGASPHTYEPTPSQMEALSRAKMYAGVGSGVEFELAWMDKLIATNKKMLVIDCSRGIVLQESEDEDEHHGAMDPHIWMSPSNAQIMVRNICEGLIQLDPGNRAYYEQNREAYLQKLIQLDQDIRAGLAGVPNRTLMVYHPAFGYFAGKYNLTMLPIAGEGKEPTPASLAGLVQQAKEHNVKVIFASPQFNPESARVIARAIGGRVVFIDPLTREYILNLRVLLGELGEALK
ncbi:metal ABC transporter solute-binding protein, Zn/Mn family [Chloroflexota bacterium]